MGVSGFGAAMAMGTTLEVSFGGQAKLSTRPDLFVATGVAGPIFLTPLFVAPDGSSIVSPASVSPPSALGSLSRTT